MEATGLAGALQELRNTIWSAATPRFVELDADDGAGGKLKVSVALTSGPDGAIAAEGLLGALKDAEEYARQRRLDAAHGPDRREGVAQHQTLESFIAHAKRFRAPNSAVWADAVQRRLVSVLDYHPEGADSPARWGKHRGVYPCPLSEAWTAWGGSKGLELDQDAFAALLDARDRELIGGTMPNGKEAPAPAALITLANNLEVYSSATAKRERDLNTGRLKISYSEDKGVAGSILPPPAFLISIPVFQDSTPQVLEVRLRVTVDSGHAKFSVGIHASGDVLRNAFETICERVRLAAEVPVFCGVAE